MDRLTCELGILPTNEPNFLLNRVAGVGLNQSQLPPESAIYLFRSDFIFGDFVSDFLVGTLFINPANSGIQKTSETHGF